MSKYDLVAGDGGSVLHATVRDNVTHALVDLSAKTVKVRYSLNGAAVVEKTMTARNQATNKGEADYQFLPADLTAAGELIGEICLQKGLSDQLTTVDTFLLVVRSPL